jgi:hypothetical protein
VYIGLSTEVSKAGFYCHKDVLVFLMKSILIILSFYVVRKGVSRARGHRNEFILIFSLFTAST